MQVSLDGYTCERTGKYHICRKPEKEKTMNWKKMAKGTWERKFTLYASPESASAKDVYITIGCWHFAAACRWTASQLITINLSFFQLSDWRSKRPIRNANGFDAPCSWESQLPLKINDFRPPWKLKPAAVW